MSEQPTLLVEDVMREIRRRVGERLGKGMASDEETLVAIEEVFQNALDARDGEKIHCLNYLGPEEEWTLNKPVVISSHRGAVGKLLVLLKERLLVPMHRWLYEYSRQNFVRQHRLNLVTLSCVESLIAQNTGLWKRIRALEAEIEDLKATTSAQERQK